MVLHGFDKSLRAPGYLALNPAGRVPALEIDGRVVCGKRGDHANTFASGSPRRVLAGHRGRRARRLADLAAFRRDHSQHSAALTQQHIALYDDAMRSPVVMRLEAKRLEKRYAALEQRLAGRTHLLDGGFSAADIGIGQALYMARHFAKVEPFAALAAWYCRVTARPAFIRSLPPKGAALLYARDFYEAWDG